MHHWFTEFCNSQCLIHFTAPFIIVWTKASITEGVNQKLTSKVEKQVECGKSLTWFASPKQVLCTNKFSTLQTKVNNNHRKCPFAKQITNAQIHNEYMEVRIWKHANDPSAGSPTETLLRLLLPLNVKVYSTFRKERRNCRPRSPKYSPEHSIGRSDGRCVQRAGT